MTTILIILGILAIIPALIFLPVILAVLPFLAFSYFVCVLLAWLVIFAFSLAGIVIPVSIWVGGLILFAIKLIL